MSFDKKAVSQLAHLARIKLENTGENHPIQNDLKRIVAMVEKIQSIDTKNIEPMSHPLEDLIQRVRKDLVNEPNQRNILQKLAPSADAGFYLVPQVIE